MCYIGSYTVQGSEWQPATLLPNCFQLSSNMRMQNKSAGAQGAPAFTSSPELANTAGLLPGGHPQVHRL